jgi:hypothetical protein
VIIRKLIFISFLAGILAVASFSFALQSFAKQNLGGQAATSSLDNLGTSNFESLQMAYYSMLQQLVVLLQEQVAALSKNASSSADVATSSLPVSSQSTSTAPVNNYSGSLFNYYPTWHLTPGKCSPELY